MKHLKAFLFAAVASLVLSALAETTADEIGPIPTTYRPVEWIESSNVYFDLGVLGNAGLAADVGVTWCGDATPSGIFLGASIDYGVRLRPLYAASGCFSYDYNKTTYSTGVSIESDVYYRIETVLRKGKQTMKVWDEDGTMLADYAPPTASTTAISTNNKLYLFANDGSGNAGTYSTQARCHYLKLWSVTAEDVRTMLGDFVPCVRRSDGAIGLYDRVTANFLTRRPKVVGTLVAGPDRPVLPSVSVESSCGIKFGTPSPAYGVHENPSGSYTFTLADATGTKDGATYACRGWRIDYADGTSETGSGLSKTVAYTQPMTLTWLFDVTCDRCFASVEDGGDDENGDGTVAHPYATPEKAIADIAASPTRSGKVRLLSTHYTNGVTLAVSGVDEVLLDLGGNTLDVTNVTKTTRGNLTITGSTLILTNGTLSCNSLVTSGDTPTISVKKGAEMVMAVKPNLSVFSQVRVLKDGIMRFLSQGFHECGVSKSTLLVDGGTLVTKTYYTASGAYHYMGSARICNGAQATFSGASLDGQYSFVATDSTLSIGGVGLYGTTCPLFVTNCVYIGANTSMSSTLNGQSVEFVDSIVTNNPMFSAANENCSFVYRNCSFRRVGGSGACMDMRGIGNGWYFYGEGGDDAFYSNPIDLYAATNCTLKIDHMLGGSPSMCIRFQSTKSKNFTFELSGGTCLTNTGSYSMTGDHVKMIVDDSKYTQYATHDNQYVGGNAGSIGFELVFRGTSPSFKNLYTCAIGGDAATTQPTVTYELPTGGYAEAPLQPCNTAQYAVSLHSNVVVNVVGKGYYKGLPIGTKRRLVPLMHGSSVVIRNDSKRDVVETLSRNAVLPGGAYLVYESGTLYVSMPPRPGLAVIVR